MIYMKLFLMTLVLNDESIFLCNRLIILQQVHVFPPFHQL